MTCGFPSRGGELGKKSLTRGQCWPAVASEDNHAEIFINPVIDSPELIAAILAHELIHAALPDAGHKGPFAAVGRRIGFKAPFTTVGEAATAEFLAWAAPLIAQAGEYPHGRLNARAAVGAPKKQVARMLKAECDVCGYTVRLARKWIVEAGAPICPRDMIPMTCEGLGDDDAGDDGEGEA